MLHFVDCMIWRSGRLVTPLPAALYKRHFCESSASQIYSANTVRSWMFDAIETALYCASIFGDVNVLKWLLVGCSITALI